MTQQRSEGTSRANLNDIREGMDVYDVNDNHIGTVERFHFGASTEGGLAATTNDVGARGNSLVEDFWQAFTTDDVPDVLRARLMEHGFIRIDADGIFASDRYVTLDRVASVGPDRVTLSVARDQLITS